MPDTYQRTPPLIVHVIFQLGTGGLENGLVNLINNLPPDKYRHAIVCMRDYTHFRERITRDNVEIYCLNKKAGKDFLVYYRLWRLLLKIKPDILHTRNLSALEAQLPGFFSGAKLRIHGEHGRDLDDLNSNSHKYRWLRQFFRLFIQRYVPMSKDLENWLIQDIKVSPKKISQIYNGVDVTKFKPVDRKPIELLPDSFKSEKLILIGTVGRQERVKDPATLLQAFIDLKTNHPQAAVNARLILVGSGSLHQSLREMTETAGVAEQVWLAGDRSDVAKIMQTFDIFVLPSISEGISNTILEAMATGLPVIATRVGGNPELVIDEQSGYLVGNQNPQGLANAIKSYIDHPEIMKQHGEFGRKICQEQFSLQRMLQDYMSVYDQLTKKRG